LEINVLAKRRIETAGDYDWWPDKTPLPAKMRVFYDKKNASCALLKPGAKRKGLMRGLCCDGAEPRCNFGASAALYDFRE
jgi:hypothetical protein